MKYIGIFRPSIPIRPIYLTGFSSQIVGFFVKRCWQHWCVCVCVCTCVCTCVPRYVCVCVYVLGYHLICAPGVSVYVCNGLAKHLYKVLGKGLRIFCV